MLSRLRIALRRNVTAEAPIQLTIAFSDSLCAFSPLLNVSLTVPFCNRYSERQNVACRSCAAHLGLFVGTIILSSIRPIFRLTLVLRGEVKLHRAWCWLRSRLRLTFALLWLGGGSRRSRRFALLFLLIRARWMVLLGKDGLSQTRAWPRGPHLSPTRCARPRRSPLLLWGQ